MQRRYRESAVRAVQLIYTYVLTSTHVKHISFAEKIAHVCNPYIWDVPDSLHMDYTVNIYILKMQSFDTRIYDIQQVDRPSQGSREAAGKTKVEKGTCAHSSSKITLA